MDHIKNKIKEESGLAMLETAVMSFFIFLFFSFLFSGGQTAVNKMMLNYATQMAARKACVATNINEARTIVNNELQSTLKSCGMSVQNIKSNCTSNNWKKGNTFNITADITYATLFPIPTSGENFGSSTQNMRSTFVGMVEYIR